MLRGYHAIVITVEKSWQVTNILPTNTVKVLEKGQSPHVPEYRRTGCPILSRPYADLSKYKYRETA